ncbi:hypothetical protein OE88DRAFT_1664416 [Heliocybe sulcata]|uniref:Zn(2)-C6 fungal-type domain-containing protein n=1 Tax=Heliocybe sulcata TaxID=5364 RepID=A0A5C3MST2_9AGAM|nr:hypothetical protein OE88DRAFT_1664416 [Heliocybe sulcata]
MRRTLNTSDSQPPAKRKKSRQACVACRKHKTRCESLETDYQTLRCHRCNVLAIPCSFETSDAVQDRGSPPGTSAEGPESPHGSSHGTREGTPTLASPSSSSLPVVYAPPPREPYNWSTSITPEALLANRPTDSDAYDWLGVPMLAMQHLLRRQASVPRGPAVSSIRDILTVHEIGTLITLFDNRYTPWLHISLDHMNRHPFLDLVRCTVVARHIEASRRATILPRLYGLVDSYVLNYAFSTAQTMESVTAFLILSLWPLPSGTGSSDGLAHDSRMIAASAVSAAKQLSLDQSIAAALQLHVAQDGSPARDNSDLESALNKARLWLAVVSAEWTLCLGTGRNPSSQYADEDYGLFKTVCPSLDTRSRDLRLHFLTRIQSIAQKALQMRITDPGPSAVKAYRSKLSEHILGQLVGVYTCIQPLGVIAVRESYQFDMLLIQYHACRVLILSHSLDELRRHNARNRVNVHEAATNWWATLHVEHQKAAQEWGLDTVTSAQALLVTFLAHEASDDELATAPDNIFAIILMAATMIMLSKTSAMRNYRGAESTILSSSEELLPRLIPKLRRVADISDAAQKCADSMWVLLRTWRTEATARGIGYHREEESPPLPPSQPNTGPSTPSSISEVPEVLQNPQADVPTPGMHEGSFPPDVVFTHHMDFGINDDMMLDVDFWNTFAQNLHST